MSEKGLRRRLPRCWRPRLAYPSQTPRLRTTRTRPHHRQSAKRSSKHGNGRILIKRCASEPCLWSSTVGLGQEDQQRSSFIGSEGEWAPFFRPQTCTDVFAASSYSSGFEGYNKDAKVVINVSVEGSPGAVRTMVKLGSSVENTIKLVIDKYAEEGRSPKLDCNSGLELHHSYFSLQSLDKSQSIGDAGSRSFYLRKNSSTGHSINGAISNSFVSELIAADQIANSPTYMFTAIIARTLSKIVRRTRRLWKILICSK